MFFGPALTAAWRATTLEVTRAAGRYDAVVIGAGAAGGIAALSLTEGGLRVLVLDAGLTSIANSFARAGPDAKSTTSLSGERRSSGAGSSATANSKSVLRVAVLARVVRGRR